MTYPSRTCENPALHRRPWSVAGCEPRLEDVLADPLVHLVMRRDGVEPGQLRALIARVRARQRGPSGCCLCAA